MFPIRSTWKKLNPSRWRRAWLLLLAGCVLVVGVVDTTLLSRSTGFFTTGFNGVYIDSILLYGGYALASIVLDLALVLGLWALGLPLIALLRARRLQTLLLAGALGTGVPLLIAAARYNIHAMLGKMASVSLMYKVARGSSATVAAQALENTETIGLLILSLAGAALLTLTIAARKLEPRTTEAERRFERPPLRSIWAGFAACALLALVIVIFPSDTMARMRYGLRTKPSQILLLRLIQRATDLDRDGYGWMVRPPDPAPFDSAVHPYAIDIPGNGVDENGVAGDHPLAFEPLPVVTPPPSRGEKRPHVLLIFLETFRADLLGARLGGREITPFLNRLAREGASSPQAFVHSPSTIPARAHLFTGDLAFGAGASTLIDDFKDRGYTVGYFSGQDESYGDSESLLGGSRADVFYDARRDIAKRTSRSVAAVALQVSWKTVLSRVRDFLATLDPEKPLFLYVNFTDAHFPYFHDEIDPILDAEPLAREDIRADHAEKVWRAYANTVANVDRAVDELIGSWRTQLRGGDHAIVVTADHGQAFYEKGFLGHGAAIDALQTRVPLILWGIGGDWPQPLGLTDIRGLLWRNLETGRNGGVPVARFVPDPQRRILQWAPNLRRPHVVGLRGLEQIALYDFRASQFRVLTPEETPLHTSPEEAQKALHEVIWNWEAVQQREAESGLDAYR